MLKSKASWIVETVDDDVDLSIIDILLQRRGITTESERQQFLYPSLDQISDPSQFNDIDEAKERVFSAIENGEKIFVYGDYDADGVTSTTVLMKTLQALDAKCDYYIPNRFLEGYGLNNVAIDYMANEGASLIITVDNGIANVEEVAYIKSLGMDVIITDHHEVQDEIPDALAIIHPKLSPAYSCKYLAGVGVAFQFAYHLLDYMPTEWLDLVAIGTVADLVPLVDENRVLVTYGLKQLAKTDNIGLQTLKKIANVGEEISEKDIGFMIAPRINAVGRLDNATLAVQLLLTEDEEEAQFLAEEIEALNKERQQIVEKIVQQAEGKVNTDDGVIILYDEQWHEGVLGIAASRLVQKFDRPVIMLTHKQDTNELKGSARSIGAFDLFENCMEIKHLFTAFGGHAQAAGMTFPMENLNEIKQFLHERIYSLLDKEDFKRQIRIDASVSINALTESLVQQINALAPFGMNNEEPILHVRGIPSQVRQIGQDNKHLKLQFKKDSGVLDVIAFSKGELFHFIAEKTPIDIVGKLQINEWNGIKTVQIFMEDMAIHEWQLFDYRGKRSEKNIVPFFNHYDSNLIVVYENETMQQFAHYANVQTITYEVTPSTIEKVDCLYIYDLPHDLIVLQEIVRHAQPKAIHLCFEATEDAFLQSIPTRDEFKRMYSFLLQQEPVHLKSDLPKIIYQQKWSKEKAIFMLKVFFDLKFIRVENDLVYINQDVEKTALDKSRTYQFQLQQSEIERTLYYSNYNELKSWFLPLMHEEQENREEVTL